MAEVEDPYVKVIQAAQEHAERLASFGARGGLIPLVPDSKRPLTADWPNKGTLDPDKIEAMFRDNETQNYGVVCEGLTIIDFDPRNLDVRDYQDENQVEHMIALIRESHGLGETFEVVTGAAGTHLYYIGETTPKKLANGVDVKSGRSHQVVGPGSTHPRTRKLYRVWANQPGSPLPGSFTLHKPTANLLDGVGSAVATGESASLPEEGFEEGDRNNGMYRHLCKMRALGMNDTELEIYARVANKARVSPPLTDSEIDLLVRQAQKFQIGTALLDSITADAIESLRPEPSASGDNDAVSALADKLWFTRDDLGLIEEPVYLIKKVLPSHGVGQLNGQSYAGKTFVALDMALSLASGEPTWFGHETNVPPEGIKVAYIAMEGGFDLKLRVNAWEQHRGAKPTDNIRYLVEKPFDLMGETGLTAFKALGDWRPQLVFIDTQSLAAPTLDENDNSAMTQLMSTSKLIANAIDAMVILVHHSGHGNTDRGRGASSQYANTDLTLMVQHNKKSDTRHLKMTKLKSGSLVKDMPFDLVPAGDSVVADFTTVEEYLENEGIVERTWSDGVQHVLDTIREEVERHGDGVTYKALSDLTGRSERQIRRDVDLLETEHLIRRSSMIATDGGALPTRVFPEAEGADILQFPEGSEEE